MSQHPSTEIDPQESQHILHNAPIGVFKTTPQGKYLYANPALAKMYGYQYC
jgi:PAS domain-containing protein